MEVDRDMAPEFSADSIAGNAIGDQATLIDKLGFQPYVEAIARFLTSDATKPPITISIEGDWGSGKSSFLLQLEQAVRGGAKRTSLFEMLTGWLVGSLRSQSRTKKALTVRFNAWRHDKQDALWAAFALAFVKALRAEVGVISAWRGDAYLFLKRLKGWRAWLELLMLVISVVATGFAILEFVHFLRIHPDASQTLLNWLTAADVEPKPSVDPHAMHKENALAPILRYVASGGILGTLAALGLGGVIKFHSHFKMPLSLKLDKYIARPDYEGHSEFIESFHDDFNRLVKAYAGQNRVFIFIDDLDRCDVPRAADLMQAINLMIGDTENLVFIIGMDREKVAAGIAQKYKDVLPFLRESANWKPNNSSDNYTPLYFGYAYLEKFIQISFSLPVAIDDRSLEGLLTEPPAQEAPSFVSRLFDGWFQGGIARSLPTRFETKSGVLQNADGSIQQRPAETRELIRLKVERDSEKIVTIVKSVRELLEFNPRRIKQFVNTFRLALYIASDQGLFDKVGARPPKTTPEQIGKFIALLLRFPDLRFALEEDGKLLAKLQAAACDSAVEYDSRYHWLSKPGTKSLLIWGCGADASDGVHSLADFDVSCLLSVLPRVPRTKSGSALAANVFNDLGAEYEKIRDEQPSGNKRTENMTLVARRIIEEAQKASPSDRSAWLAEANYDQPGARLVRTLIAYVDENPENITWLKYINRNYVSPFEHYWCIQTLIKYTSMMTETDRYEIERDLGISWPDIVLDHGREGSAIRLRKLVQPTAYAMSPPPA